MLLLSKFVLAVGVVSGALWWHSVPSWLQERKAVTQKLYFLDREGRELRSYHPGETYDWMPLEEVPKELIDLVLLAEDKEFFHHSGIDVPSTLRSSWLNLRSLRVVSGASTITQQLYRIGHGIDRTFTGKLTTLVGALKVEGRYTKHEILERYLNTVPFGSNLAGVKRAGEFFFGKGLHHLGLAEMAALAVLPRAPTRLAKNEQELLSRRNKLLEEYAVIHKLHPDEKALALRSPVKLEKNHLGWDNYHFIRASMERPEFPRYVDSQGRVRTTLDFYLQNEASVILRSQLDHLKKFDVHHGAVLVLDNRTGGILAYVGSQAIDERKGSQYDALQLKRQPGSALKPLTYALALTKGKKLSDPLPDIPSYYKTGLGQFLPRNYDQSYSGPRLMREALANSLNLPAVALADELGVEALYDFYRKMGVVLEKPSSHYGVGLTLGNVEISPINLATVFTAFARGGEGVRPTFFEGSPVETFSTPLEPWVAWSLSDVLSDTVARREEFGERNPFDLPFGLAVKTGTSTDFRDNWVVGYNPAYTIVVWVGNTDQRPMRKVSGITGAGPVLSEIALYLSKKKLMKAASRPSDIEQTEICSLSGLRPGAHCPHKKLEYFKKGMGPIRTCSWHREITVRDCRESGSEEKVKVSVLPDRYQAFVASRPSWSVDQQIQDYCPNSDRAYNTMLADEDQVPAIQRPLSGSIFALDPNIPRKFQKLKLELNRFHEVKSVIWKRNGQGIGRGPSSIDWPLEKGDHVFEAEVIFLDGKKVQTRPIEVKVL